jgi:hypothetical protein
MDPTAVPPVPIPSLQIELVGDPSVDENVSPDRSETSSRTSYLLPMSHLRPPSFHTVPKRALLILSPNSPYKR